MQLDIFESNNVSTILESSFEAYEKKDVDFFARRLDNNYFYRIALSYPEDVIFVDIETTGLSKYYDQITLVGC